MSKMVRTWCVYKHTSPNGKVYIGITSRKPETRWDNGWGYKDNKYFFRAIQKYGWKNFTHEIIAGNLSKDVACNLEKRLIAEYDSTNEIFGYNHSIGGELASLGCHREGKRGKESPRYGVRHSDEVKQKISLSRKGQLTGDKNHKSKPVLCVELNVVFDSLGEAERNLPIKRKAIWRALQRNNGTSGGYHWRWANAK